MKSKFGGPFVLAGLLSILAACGGGGGGGFAPTPSSAGGFWQGTVTADAVTQDTLGVVSETGQFHFLITPDFNNPAPPTQYYGTLTINGNRGTGSFTGLAPPGTTFADGSVRGTGTLNVTIQQRSKLTATGTFTTANNSTSNVSMTVQYDAGYEADSSLATLNGNYTSAAPQSTDVLNLNDGQLNYTATTTCNAVGMVSIIDTRYNLYSVDFTYGATGCGAQNALRLQGLLAIDVTASPAQMIILTHGTLQSVPVAVPFAFLKT